MILTEKEIEALRNYCREIDPRDVEAAVIATLSKGVSVEPRKCKKQSHGFKWVTYEAITLDQLQTAIAAARVQALEEAAKVVEADKVKNPITAYQLQYNKSLQHTAKDIRALIGKEST